MTDDWLPSSPDPFLWLHDIEWLPQVESFLDGGGSERDPVMAREVASLLATFFSGYHDRGELVALPRYPDPARAMSADGRDVKLHWPHLDHLHLKAAEHPHDLTTDLEGVIGLERPRLRFRLSFCEPGQDQQPAALKRRYMLREADPVELRADELTVWFDYRVPESGTRRQPAQGLLNEATESRILAALPTSDWHAVLSRKADRGAGTRTLLGDHLHQFTRRQASDRFIHKDLGGFLRKELDFFIKNEVFLLEETEGLNGADLEASLRKIRVLRAVGHAVVERLSRIENARKNLFLKRKFVLRSRWIFTLDEVPEPDRPQMWAIPALVETWCRLTGLTATELRFRTDLIPGLPVDTSLLPGALATRLIVALGDRVERPSGCVVAGENFQALRLMQARFRGDVQFVYLDPPYNTGGNGFLYRDGYRQSAWASMIIDRLAAVRELMSPEGVAFFSIDGHSNHLLKILGQSLFGAENEVGEIAVCLNPKGRQLGEFFATSHEYLLTYARDVRQTCLVAASVDAVNQADFPLEENGLSYRLLPLRNTNRKFNPQTRPNLYYPLYIDTGTGEVRSVFFEGAQEVFPVFGSGEPAVWRWGRPKAHLEATALTGRLVKGRKGERWDVFQKDVCAGTRTRKLTSFWTSEESGSTDGAVAELKAMGCAFTSPKPTKLIRRLLGLVPSHALVLDCFAGSGTTGAATWLANAQDGGSRRFLLVEMGDHVWTTILPRLQKMMISLSWKDGRPAASPDQTALSRPTLLRVCEIESHDDALENVWRPSSDGDPVPLVNAHTADEGVTLGYMFEAPDVAPRLNVDRFLRPWDCRLRVRRNGIMQDSPVDMVETFNLLIGLRVNRYETLGQEGLLFVRGDDPAGRRVTVIWRDCARWSNCRLETLWLPHATSLGNCDVIFVNGDLPLPDLATREDFRMVEPIEETFLARMFDAPDVG